MSWLFGIKTPTVNVPPPPEGGGNDGADKPGSDGKPPESNPEGSRMAYSFDSAALERAAKAAKELDKSSNNFE